MPISMFMTTRTPNHMGSNPNFWMNRHEKGESENQNSHGVQERAQKQQNKIYHDYGLPRSESDRDDELNHGLWKAGGGT